MRIRGMGSEANDLRSIPSVDRLINDLAPTVVPRPLVVCLARAVLGDMRSEGVIPPYEEAVRRLEAEVKRLERMRLQRLVNATGIPLHTNLGRAPLAASVGTQVGDIARGYSNLEFDLGTGKRGRRGDYAERCLAQLTGASGVAVVNNCAAALILILNQAVRSGRSEVVISRGEMVQIGGGFRIPDILASSGARMREVGTTNRTTVADYEAAIGEETGMILVVHRSNFFMEGFVASPELRELVRLGERSGIPVVYDQGSGSLVDTGRYPGVPHERTVSEAIDQGASLVCFSGDKLFGGPQAGIVAGNKEEINALKKNPLFRALRCDKLVLCALQATAEAYLRMSSDKASDGAVPVHEMLSESVESLRRRAEALCSANVPREWQLAVADTVIEVGGGTLPQSRVPSVAVTVRSRVVPGPQIARAFREASMPIIGYVTNGAFHLDLRTVDPRDDEVIIQELKILIQSQRQSGEGLGE